MDPLPILFSFLSGMGIGFFFFSALMLTILLLRSSRRPGLLLALSFILRAGPTIVVFLLAGKGRWQNFLALFAGFLFARQITILMWRPAKGRETNGEAGIWKF